MAIEIYDEVDSGIDSAFVDKIYDATLQNFKLKDVFEVELSIVDKDTIQQTNKETRNVDSVTDVLSFPNLRVKFPVKLKDYADEKNPMTGKIILGEIMLCKDRAIEQAEEYGHSFDRECGYLVAHGLLHLLGFDHMQDDEKIVMRNHEEKILTSIGIVRE
ncbi:MAG: rRNA maturation RNase YbeY [Clostridia bacterium]